MDASELVQQMHDTLSAIHDTISGISTDSHDALLTELEQKRDSLLDELRSTFDKEHEEVTIKRQAEIDEVTEKRRIEDEERDAKRRLEDEEYQSKNDAEDLERHEKLDGDIKVVDEETDKQMDVVEAAAQKIIDEARDKLRELEEKRKEINRLIDEHLESPPFPPVPTRKRARAGEATDHTEATSEEQAADSAEAAEEAPAETVDPAEDAEEAPAEAAEPTEEAAPVEEVPAEPAEEAAPEPAEEAKAEPAEEVPADAPGDNEERALVVVNGGDVTTSEPAPEDQEDQSNNNDKAPEAEAPSPESEEATSTEDTKEAESDDGGAGIGGEGVTDASEEGQQQSEEVNLEEPEQAKEVSESDPVAEQQDGEAELPEEAQSAGLQVADSGIGLDPEVEAGKSRPASPSGSESPNQDGDEERDTDSADEVQDGEVVDAKPLESEATDVNEDLNTSQSDPMSSSDEQHDLPKEDPDQTNSDGVAQVPTENDEQSSKDVAAEEGPVTDSHEDSVENEEHAAESAESSSTPLESDVAHEETIPVADDTSDGSSPEVVLEQNDEEMPSEDHSHEEPIPVATEDSPEFEDPQELQQDDSIYSEHAERAEEDASISDTQETSAPGEPGPSVEDPSFVSQSRTASPTPQPESTEEHPTSPAASRPATPNPDDEEVEVLPTRSSTPEMAQSSDDVSDLPQQGGLETDVSELPEEPSNSDEEDLPRDTEDKSHGPNDREAETSLAPDPTDDVETETQSEPKDASEVVTDEQFEAVHQSSQVTDQDNHDVSQADASKFGAQDDVAQDSHISFETEDEQNENQAAASEDKSVEANDAPTEGEAAALDRDLETSLINDQSVSQYSSVDGEAGSHILSSDVEHGESDSVNDKEEIIGRSLLEKAAMNEQEHSTHEPIECYQDGDGADQSLQESLIDDQVGTIPKSQIDSDSLSSLTLNLVQSHQRSQLLGEPEERSAHDEERKHAKEDQERGLERQEEENSHPAEDHSSIVPEEGERYLEFNFPDDDYSYNISVSETSSHPEPQHVTHDYTYDNTVLRHSIDDSTEYSMSAETDEDSRNLSVNVPTRQKTISPLPVENVTVQGQDDLFDDTETASSHFSDEEDSEIIDSALPEQRTFSGDRIQQASLGQYDGASWGGEDFTEDYASSVEPPSTAPVIQEPTPTPTQSRFDFARSFGIRMVDEAEPHGNPQLGTPDGTPNLEPVSQRNVPDISPLVLQDASPMTPNRRGLSSSRHAPWNDPQTPTRQDMRPAQPELEPEIDPTMFAPRDVTHVPWHARNDSEPFSMRSQSTLSSNPSSPVHSSLPVDKHEPVIRDSWHNPVRSRASTQFTDRNAAEEFDPFKHDSPRPSPYDINSPRRSVQVDRPVLESSRNSMTGSPMFQKLRSMFEPPGGGDSNSRGSSPTRSRPVSSIFQTVGRERSSSQLRESHIPSRPSSPRKSFVNDREYESDERSALLH